MPSPFPGMNPYLEHPHVWEDFHGRFLVYASEPLIAQTVPDYVVRIGEHVYVEDADGDREYHADLAAAVAPGAGPSAGGGVATLAAPSTVRLPAAGRKRRQKFLEVRDRADYRVVTVIELLSPSNKKAGKDRDQFELKRNTILAGDVNYVEIDLLRGGTRLPAGGRPDCDYYALVSRPAARPTAGFWPVRLRDPLPVIPVPLREGDPEPRLDLQAVLHRVYDATAYEHSVYLRPPEPPLSPADAAWADALVPARYRGQKA